MHQLTLFFTPSSPCLGASVVNLPHTAAPQGAPRFRAASSSPLPSEGPLSAAAGRPPCLCASVVNLSHATARLSPAGSAAVPAAPVPVSESPCSSVSSPRAPGRAHCWALLDLMRDGQWRTPYEIHEATGIGLLSVTARLRDLRHPRYGACQLNHRQRAGAPLNTFEYQLIPPLGS